MTKQLQIGFEKKAETTVPVVPNRVRELRKRLFHRVDMYVGSTDILERITGRGGPIGALWGMLTAVDCDEAPDECEGGVIVEFNEGETRHIVPLYAVLLQSELDAISNEDFVEKARKSTRRVYPLHRSG